MGDVIMSGPALHALKESFGCSISLLTSAMGHIISPCLPYVDDVIVCNVPWIKAGETLQPEECMALVRDLQARQFDAAIIFTAYSQSPLPAALLVYMAGIPLRLAYCRENPYNLLTHWLPDKEPYSLIRHQVRRDLDLVAAVGAQTTNTHLSLLVTETALKSAFAKLVTRGIPISDSWIIVHTGVSEKKREYPLQHWIQTVQLLRQTFDLPILLTGSAGETEQATAIGAAAGGSVHMMAGVFTIEEFVAVIHEAQLVISVNTATVHIAAATDTPVIVLYALTNPQHTPWAEFARVLPFPVQEALKSKNQVVRYVSEQLFSHMVHMPTPAEIVETAQDMLTGIPGVLSKEPAPLFYET
mgnify:CR=1 FL=1|jgi:ADP-heptose:LPS heptosyltransferase